MVTSTVTRILTDVLAAVGLRFSCAPEDAFEYLEATYNHLTVDAVTQGRPPNSPELAVRLTTLLTSLTEPVG